LRFTDPFRPQGGAIMKTSVIIWISSFIVALVASVALANPDMLPKHPGYPMGKSVDPVKGQPLANDPGQTNASGENALARSATFDDAHSSQQLSINQNDQRLLQKPGAVFFQRFKDRTSKLNRL
ncbi:MAG: hypothetical protein ABI955_10015, partial [Nitrospirota bacterium]